MKYALNKNGKKIEVEFSGQNAVCSCCGSEVKGRFGEIRPKHWYHKNLNHCDSWFEPMTQWHSDWQSKFPVKNQEVVLKNNSTNEIHIADICLNSKLVIEIQNSPIKIEEIRERENFYTKHGGLIWVLNGSSLLKKSSITYKNKLKGHYLYLNIPSYLEKVNKYDFDEFRIKIFNSSTVQLLKSHPNFIDIEVINGDSIYFNFSKKIKFNIVEEILYKDIYSILKQIYPNNQQFLKTQIDIDYYSVDKNYFHKIMLEKKYWRKFIDYMEAPVFIDAINGLDEKLLYWYQKNKIVKKEDFLYKYLQYAK